MKGFVKAVKRTPHMMTSKVGMSKKSSDPEFDEYERNFTLLEKGTDKLLKESKTFIDNVNKLFESAQGFSQHFGNVCSPLTGEYNDLASKHPEASHTLESIDKLESTLEELKATVAPELELIQTRILGPVKDYQDVLKKVRKAITKRSHKLTDYDRFNNSLTKLRDKKEKSLSDEKNLFKLEQDFELATQEYEFINTTLKNDMPTFMQLTTQFINPLFHSFYYMQLQVFYILLEKMTAFGEEAKWDLSVVPGSQIQADYEEKRTDAWVQIEDMNIIKRIISVSRMVQAHRAGTGAGAGVARSPTFASSSSASSSGGLRSPPPSRGGGSFKKAPPPPPPGSAGGKTMSAPPPPYSANGGASPGASSSSGGAPFKKAPPPPPPLKPKPKPPAPKVQYVVALYDFEAQADGDLSFNTGDQIEIVQRSDNAEDWWTGRLNGVQGIFPGNYVQDM